MALNTEALALVATDKPKAEPKAKPAPKPKAEPKVKAAPMPEKNGIKQPRPGGLCAKAWDLFDEVRKGGDTPAIATLIEKAKAKGLNEGNVRCEFSRWRKFHGLPAAKAPLKVVKTVDGGTAVVANK